MATVSHLSSFNDLQGKYNEVNEHQMPSSEQGIFDHYHTATLARTAEYTDARAKYSVLLDKMQTLIARVGTTTVPETERASWKEMLKYVAVSFQRFDAKRDIYKLFQNKLDVALTTMTRPPIPDTHLVTLEQMTPGFRVQHTENLEVREDRLRQLTEAKANLTNERDQTRALKHQIMEKFEPLHSVAYYGTVARPTVRAPERTWSEVSIRLETYQKGEDAEESTRVAEVARIFFPDTSILQGTSQGSPTDTAAV